MYYKRLLLLFLSLLIVSKVNAQQDSVLIKPSEILIFEIDELINYTRSEIDKDDKKNSTTIPQAIKKMNEENCNKLYMMLPYLKTKLYLEYGEVENVKYQIEPFMISLSKCINALKLITTQSIYVEVEKVNYETAFLFKEIAKGNLFRVVGERLAKPKLFCLSVNFGYQGNPMYKTFTDAYSQSEWRDEEGGIPKFKNNKASRSLLYNISLDYRISKKAIAGLSFQSLPSAFINARAQNTDSVNMYDYSSESFSGNAVNFHAAYILSGTKKSHNKLEFLIGANFQLNNFTVEREITTIQSFLSSYTVNSVTTIDTVLVGFEPQISYIIINNFTDTIFSYSSAYEIQKQKNNYHSLSFGIQLSAKYYLTPLLSIYTSLSQNIDSGVKVDEMKFSSRTLPSYQLKLNSFAFRVGLGLLF